MCVVGGRVRVVVCGDVCAYDGGPATTPEGEIMKADREFNKATQEKGAEGWLSYFAPDDAAVPDPPTAGRQANTERYQKTFADPEFKLTWDPNKAEVFPSGKVGYTTGKYVARFKEKDGRIIGK
jgi:ketosteroid isomerase-like protein